MKPEHTDQRSIISSIINFIFPFRSKFNAIHHSIDQLAHLESEHIIRLEGEIESLKKKITQNEEEIHDMNLIISEKSDILEQMEDEEEKLKQEIRTLYSAIKSIEKRIAMIEHKTCRPVDSEHKYQDFDTRHDDEYID